ncbi:hypothetical protein CR513_15613, partial [Mucuna pruriens]
MLFWMKVGSRPCKKNDVWKLVSPSKGKSIIGTKWIFINKLEENGKVVRKKAKLEAIHILLFFTTHNHMRLHQMDVECAFLNDIINEEIYVKQPLGFESDAFLIMAFYGLKQAPRTWYEILSSFLMSNGFERGKVETIFLKNYNSHFIIVQIYMDDIIWCYE